MADAARLRVLVALGPAPVPDWHRRVVELLGEVPDVVTVTGAWPAAPDVVVDLAGAVPAQVAARYGTWKYGFGDGAAFAGGAAGTLARLYRTAADPRRCAVLVEGWFRGDSNDAPGTADVGALVAGWCARVAREIVSGDARHLRAPMVDVGDCSSPVPPDPPGFGVRQFRDRVSRWRRRERWTIGLVRATLPEILERGSLPEPRWVTETPADRYLADPFPLSADDAHVHLLAEEYRYGRGSGTLVRLTLTHEARIVDCAEWLAPPHHVAYPFVLRDGAAAVCVPDGAASGAVRAYALNEPSAPPATLLEGMAGVDPTLVRHDGRWWLFCTDRDRENQTNLHVFHAPDWRGPWEPHALNPVKSDARSSRPAGACMTVGGTLYRPAQDCSRRYGGAIALNAIEELTPSRFRERVAVTLRPERGWAWPDGLHTINAVGHLIVVDGLRVER